MTLRILTVFFSVAIASCSLPTKQKELCDLDVDFDTTPPPCDRLLEGNENFIISLSKRNIAVGNIIHNIPLAEVLLDADKDQYISCKLLTRVTMLKTSTRTNDAIKKSKKLTE